LSKRQGESQIFIGREKRTDSPKKAEEKLKNKEKEYG
jgi:hypothetical protein